ncbi:hypothetical protein ACTMTF_06130 [Nonomuraea sp. ZG12]|uniref:hypothetical protein n=1 Tax=Nonomuraea sp. ZG12 TaxID=3452207 RepID=UPI003F889E75
MTEPSRDGFDVRPDALRRGSHAYDEQWRTAAEVRDLLRAAFDHDRKALGDDEYGAELAKKLPGIESGIFTALRSYIDALDRIAPGLHTSAANYEAADRPPAAGS